MSFEDDYLEADYELLYWQFDARHLGHGPFAEADGTLHPVDERQAFKDTLRNWETLRLLSKLRKTVASQGGVSPEVHSILGQLSELRKKVRKDVG